MREFSPPHLAALGVLAAAVAISVLIPRRYAAVQAEIYARLLVLLIFAGWAGEYIADVVTSTWSARYTLPLQLTDAVSLSAILSLVTRRRLLVELTYFWALTASLQAALTPDLGQDFPSVFYFTYFAYHVGAIAAACLLVFGCRMYPRSGAALRVFAATLAWTAIAGIGDAITGGNYMYLSSKPAHNSLLDVLGPWPWYIVSAAAVGLAMLLALQLLTEWVRRHDMPPTRIPQL